MKDITLSLLLAAIAVLSPIYTAMTTCGVLIFFDLILGLIAAKRQGIKIESRKLKFTVVKMLVYQLVIISAFLAEKYMIDFIPLNKITDDIFYDYSEYEYIDDTVNNDEQFTDISDDDGMQLD